MLEKRIVSLVMADAAVLALCKAGGYFVELPKDYALPNWTYRSISDKGDYMLGGEHGFSTRRLQIDAFASTAGGAIDFSNAIDKVLSGFKGTLGNGAGSTVVFGCFNEDTIDFFDDAARTFRRMTEYVIQYCEQ